MSTIVDYVLFGLIGITLLAVVWVSKPYLKRGVSNGSGLVTEGPDLCVAEIVKRKHFEIYNTGKMRVFHEDSVVARWPYAGFFIAGLVCAFVMFYVLVPRHCT